MLSITPMLTDVEKEGKAYVHWKAWTEAYTHLLPESFWEDYTLERCREWAFRYPDNILLAKLDEKIIGFVCYGSSMQTDLENTGEVYALYVLADYYDQKVGYQLIQAALEKMASYDKISLWVLDGNERAIAFYQKVGFRFDGVTKTVHLGKEAVEHRMILQR